MECTLGMSVCGRPVLASFGSHNTNCWVGDLIQHETSQIFVQLRMYEWAHTTSTHNYNKYFMKYTLHNMLNDFPLIPSRTDFSWRCSLELRLLCEEFSVASAVSRMSAALSSVGEGTGLAGRTVGLAGTTCCSLSSSSLKRWFILWIWTSLEMIFRPPSGKG